MDEKIKNAVLHIYCDYKAILNYILTCLNNKLDYSSYMGVMPFFCMYVVEGYDFLCKNQLINPDCVSKKDLTKLKKCRALGVKLHSEFKQSTFDSINDFNRDEYLKFYKMAFPNSKPRMLPIVDNYFISCVADSPVGNYHLYSKKVLNMEIGAYIPNISQKVYEFAYLLSSFSTKIVVAIDQSLNIKDMGTKNIQINFDYVDMNMAYGYSHFRIKKSPPILMAFLDILCVLNSYRKIFTLINDDAVFDLKVKYTILFYSVLSINSIVGYCDENDINIKMDTELISYIADIESKYIKNKIRKFCMHYDYPITTCGENPFTEIYEKEFGKSLEEVSKDVSLVIETLSERLQRYLIVRGFHTV